MFSQKDFNRLSDLMHEKGVIHEGFELLADLRLSEKEYRVKLKRAVDLICDIIINMTDEEILKQVENDCGDSEFEANKMREIIRKAKKGLAKD